jgi:hypothetical protein
MEDLILKVLADAPPLPAKVDQSHTSKTELASKSKGSRARGG